MTTLPRRRRSELADALRRHVVGSIASGTTRRGERLPSAREVAADIGADPRLVLAAYRILAREGVVEIRRRSGIYVASTPQVADGPPVMADGWLVDVMAEGVEHGIAAPRLGDWLKRCATTRRLRAAVIADTVDQIEAFAGELRDDYGIDAVPFASDALDRPAGVPAEIRDADLIVTADGYAARLREQLAPARTPVIAVQIRAVIPPELRRALAREPVYFVIADARSMGGSTADVLAAHAGRVHLMVVGRDDLRSIPRDALVYVSRSARRRIPPSDLPARLLPTERAFSRETVREVLGVVVAANLRAMRA